MQNFIDALKRDPLGEGDMNEWPRDVVVQALRIRLIVMAPCSRSFRNIRLTRKGRAISVGGVLDIQPTERKK